MKKLLMFMFLFVLSLYFVHADVATQYPQQQQNSLLSNVNQYYQVIYGGDGESYVALKMDINYVDDTPVDTFTIEVPGSTRILGVMEQYFEQGQQQCNGYRTDCKEYSTDTTCTQYDQNNVCIKYERTCLRSENVCTGYYIPQNLVYGRANITTQDLSASTLITVQLSSPLTKNGQKTLFLLYKSLDTSKALFGGYTFKFESAKVQLMTQTVRVAVNVQNDLLLKGTSSNVNYAPTIGFNTVASSMDKSVMSPQETASIQQYTQQIPYAQGYVKQNQYLDPKESFTVKGQYAQSWWSIYWWNVLVWIAVIAIIVIAIVLIAKKVRENTPEVNTSSVKQKQKAQEPNARNAVFTGMAAAFGLAVYWIIITIILNAINHSGNYDIRTMITLIVVIFSIMVTLAALIGVPMLVSSKSGLKHGFYALMSMLMTALILAIVIFFVYSGIMYHPTIMY